MQPLDPSPPEDKKGDDSSDPLGLEEAEEDLEEETSSSSDVDGTSTGCELAQLIVTVETSDGAAVSGASVTALGEDYLTPEESKDDKGTYDCGQVKVGDYNIFVKKAWHLEPTSNEQMPDQDITLRAGDKKTVPFLLDPVEIHMYLDTDRDGKADPDNEGMDTWEWGQDKKGAIVLCNNDDDFDDSETKKHESDNEDSKVNKGNDKDELAPLAIRRTGPEPSALWSATLEILGGQEDRLRIFAGRTAGSTQVLGKGEGASYKLPNLDFETLDLGMEATQYADKDWPDGLVELKLTLDNGDGETREETGKVRVAPWMMLHHGVPAKEVFVVKAKVDHPNKVFIKALKPLLPSGVKLNKDVENQDRWAQDVMEIGGSVIPHETTGTHAINAIVRSVQDRVLGPRVEDYRDRDLGFEQPVAPVKQITADSLGNLEVTPPCEDESGKEYPYGRIYYGPDGGESTFNSDMETFLQKQVVQKPFGIDTSWLAVGHVDEIVTFVPDRRSGSEKPFKALVASPYEAYRILEELRPDHDSALLLKDRELDHLLATSPTDSKSLVEFVFERSVERFLDEGYPKCKKIETAEKLRDFNDKTQDNIDKAILDTFPKEIGYSVPRPAKEIRETEKTIRELEKKDETQVLEDAQEEIRRAEEAVEKAKEDLSDNEFEIEMYKENVEMRLEDKDIDDWKKQLQNAKDKIPTLEENIRKREEEVEEKKRDAERDRALELHKKKLEELSKAEVDARKKDLEADVLRVPVLFLPYGGNTDQAIALTAGTVNMLVVNDTCIFPIPYGPVVGTVDKFQEYLETILTTLGMKSQAIDDWEPYHRMNGEVHCGTNTRREPQAWKWWEYEP